MMCTWMTGPVVVLVPSEVIRKSNIPPLTSPLSFFMDGNSVDIAIFCPVQDVSY